VAPHLLQGVGHARAEDEVKGVGLEVHGPVLLAGDRPGVLGVEHRLQPPPEVLGLRAENREGVDGGLHGDYLPEHTFAQRARRGSLTVAVSRTTGTLFGASISTMICSTPGRFS
jgi:hypothetical protein